MKRILLTFIILAAAFASLSAGEVTGTVRCGKEKISGVIVTDGRNFTMTDKKGRFKMDAADDADFIFIVTPSGFVAPYESGTPAFYIPASHKGKFDFELLKASDSKDYTFIAMTDTQASTDEQVDKFRKTAMPELTEAFAAYKAENNTFGMVLGDICWDRPALLPVFKEEFAKFGVPFYPVIGNHDHLKNAGGDHNASAEYRKYFGPENYAFSVGGDYFIMLDAILHSEQRKYGEGYTDETIAWIKGLVEFIPESAVIFVAQHPVMQQRYVKNALLENSDKLFEVLKGRKVHILCGHTHVNNNVQYTPDIFQQNIAAICSAWWDTYHCKDGTPGGYKVFEKKDGKLFWHYKSLGRPKDYQLELFGLGESVLHPNAVVANVWDYDDLWSVEWFEDGRPMGAMKRVEDCSPAFIREMKAAYREKGREVPAYKKPSISNHYFIAVPSQYSRKVEVVVTDRFGNVFRREYDMKSYIDVQAHRGGAGLMPENTVRAMLESLDMGVNTLELDLQVSADGQVVVSHDAYFHHRYATRPDGTEVKAGDPKEYIYNMPYDSVLKYDTGLRPSKVWPGKACVAACKPLLHELIDSVESHVAEKGLTPVRYNIEIKSSAEEGEGVHWPEYHEFVDKCAAALLECNLGDRLVVQCFDTRALNYLNDKYPQLILSYLVDEPDVDFDKYMSLLDFTPQWLSPYHSNVDADLCRKVWETGMKIVPWTVDDPAEIRRLADLGVDAIISNYPDRVLEITRGME